jgi:hypothetical protein
MAEIDFTTLPDQRPLNPAPPGESLRQVLATFAALVPLYARLALIPYGVTLFLFFLLQGLPVTGLSLGLATAVNIYLTVWFASSVQRLVLLGPGPETLRPLPRWRPPEARLLGRGLQLFLVAAIASVPGSLLFSGFSQGFDPAEPQLGWWMLGPVAFAVLGMLCVVLMLPAASVGSGYGLGRAWAEGRGILGTQVALFVLLLLPLEGLVLLLDWVLLQLQLATDLVVPRLAVGLAVHYLEIALGGTLLAVIFAKRTGWTAPPQGTT